MYGILELEQANPWSRLPRSEYRSLDRARKNVALALALQRRKKKLPQTLSASASCKLIVPLASPARVFDTATSASGIASRAERRLAPLPISSVAVGGAVGSSATTALSARGMDGRGWAVAGGRVPLRPAAIRPPIPSNQWMLGTGATAIPPALPSERDKR